MYGLRFGKCVALQFPSVKRRKVEADFSGGDITGNGGIALLSTVDRRLGLTRAVAGCLDDSRRQASCEHSLSDLLRRRVYALAQGHEDLNDHGELRHDLALRTAANQLRQLLSGLAYTPIEGLRRLALTNTALAHASPNRIRLTLLRIGAVVLRNTRRIRRLLSSACPHQELFRTVAVRLDSS